MHIREIIGDAWSPVGAALGMEFPPLQMLGAESWHGCVFHLMRVMEAGLKATAGSLGIPYAPSWESYLKQIGGKLEIEWKKKIAPSGKGMNRSFATSTHICSQ